MQVEKLELKHKSLLFDKLKAVPTFISEYSFANLYLFRNVHRYEVIVGDEIFIKGRTYDGKKYLMPAFDVRNSNMNFLKKMAGDGEFFFPIPEEWLDLFPSSDFDRSFDDADSDYIFTVHKMSTFEGHKLHKKRNLLKLFVQGYEHTAKPLTNDKLKDAMSVLEEWRTESGEDPNANDYYPCMEALKLYEELVLCGYIYYVENEPAGFILGEELRDDTFALHFAKGKTKFKGIYQYMYNSFAHILPKKYNYLNLEQDLGNHALKVSKESYIADMMVKKFRVKSLSQVKNQF